MQANWVPCAGQEKRGENGLNSFDDQHLNEDFSMIFLHKNTNSCDDESLN